MSEENLPKTISGATPEIPFQMYEVSGQDTISQHAFERYIKDRDQDESISKSAETREEKNLLKKIDAVNYANNFGLISENLDNPDPIMQERAAELIAFIPSDKRLELIMRFLEKGPNVQVAALEGLQHLSPEVWENILPVIKDRIDLGLNSNEEEKVIMAIKMIHYIYSSDDTSKFIMRVLTDKIEYWELLRSSLFDANEEVKNFIDELVLKKLNSKDNSDKKMVVGLLQFGHAEKILETIMKVTLDDDEFAFKMSTIIFSAPEKDQLKFIRTILDRDIRYHELAAELISYMLVNAPVEEDEPEFNAVLDETMKKAKEDLLDENVEVRRTGARIAVLLDPSNDNELTSLAIERGVSDELVKAPIYANTGVNKQKFFRADFFKTGSETTLLGGELKDKTIVRHIEPGAFLTWQKLFENYKLWQDNGFDYVPIEPIHSYRLDNNGLVDVFCGVLDLNLEDWMERSKAHNKELTEQMERITGVLEKSGIEHGHPHEKNFCLRFWRDSSGQVDFNRIPRLYLIDFDMAASLP